MSNLIPSESTGCIWCGYENSVSSVYCGNCGRELVFPLACSQCERGNPSQNRYCDSCGSFLSFFDESSVPPIVVSPALSIRHNVLSWFRRDRVRAVTIAMLALIVLSGFGIRLVSLAEIPPNVVADEADNLQVIYHIMADTGPGFWGLDWKPAPAASLYLASWVMALFGEGIFSMRLASAVLSTASLVGFYLAARQFQLSRPASLVGTLLLSTSLLYLHFSRSGWENVQVGFFVIMAVLMLTIAMRRGGWHLYAIAGVFVAMGLYGYVVGRTILIGLALYLPFVMLVHRNGWRRIALGFGVMFGTSVVLFAPQLNTILDDPETFNRRVYDVYALKDTNRSYFDERDSPRIIIEQTLDVFKAVILLDSSYSTLADNPRYVPGGKGFLDRLTGILFWFGLAVSLVRWRQSVLLWLLLFVMVFLPQILSVGSPNGARLVGALPVIYLFVVFAVDWIWSLKRGIKVLYRGMITAVVTVIVFSNVVGYFAWMGTPEAERARQPAVDISEFETWQELQKIEAQAGRAGFNVTEWHEMRTQLK